MKKKILFTVGIILFVVLCFIFFPKEYILEPGRYQCLGYSLPIDYEIKGLHLCFGLTSK